MISKLRRLRQVIRSSRLSLVHSEFKATLGCTNPCLKKILFINKASKQGRNKLGPLGPGWLVYCRMYCVAWLTLMVEDLRVGFRVLCP